MNLENHLRIANKVVVLLHVVADGNEAVSVTRLSNGQGQVSLHGESDSGISRDELNFTDIGKGRGMTPM